MKTSEKIVDALESALMGMLGIVAIVVFIAAISIAFISFLDLAGTNPIAAGGVFLAFGVVMKFLGRYNYLCQQDKNRSREQK